MKFGVFHLHSVPPWTNGHDVIETEFEQMVVSEQLGFDEIWLAEHNARRYGITGNCLVPAAAVAAATSKIRIGTAITRLPLHHPVHLAEDIAYLDNLSHGRIDWGVGRGYDPMEFGTYGVPFEEKDLRWEETLDAVLNIWSSGSTEFAGKYTNGGPGELFPRVLQHPTVPVYLMVSRSDESVKWAAERLIPISIGHGPEWDDIRHKVELYFETALAAGYDEADIREIVSQFWALKQVHTAETTKRAVDEYRDPLMWFFDLRDNRTMFGFTRETQPYEYYVEHKSILLGTVDQVVQELGDFAEYTGIQNIMTWFNCGSQPHGRVMSDLERFSAHALPQLATVRGKGPL